MAGQFECFGYMCHSDKLKTAQQQLIMRTTNRLYADKSGTLANFFFFSYRQQIKPILLIYTHPLTQSSELSLNQQQSLPSKQENATQSRYISSKGRPVNTADPTVLWSRSVLCCGRWVTSCETLVNEKLPACLGFLIIFGDWPHNIKINQHRPTNIYENNG